MPRRIARLRPAVTRGHTRPRPLSGVFGSYPIRVHPHADLIDITLLMTDYNLLNLPVVVDDDHLIGVITVDDALESTVPRDWRRREPAPHPDPDTDDTEPPPPARSAPGGTQPTQTDHT